MGSGDPGPPGMRGIWRQEICLARNWFRLLQIQNPMAAKAKGRPGSNHIGRAVEGHPSNPWSLHQGLCPLPGKDKEYGNSTYRNNRVSLCPKREIVPASSMTTLRTDRRSFEQIGKILQEFQEWATPSSHVSSQIRGGGTSHPGRDSLK